MAPLLSQVLCTLSKHNHGLEGALLDHFGMMWSGRWMSGPAISDLCGRKGMDDGWMDGIGHLNAGFIIKCY